jgi:ABC-type proline/glycine betaine transport system ATPase subunit
LELAEDNQVFITMDKTEAIQVFLQLVQLEEAAEAEQAKAQEIQEDPEAEAVNKVEPLQDLETQEVTHHLKDNRVDQDLHRLAAEAEPIQQAREEMARAQEVRELSQLCQR